MKQMKPEWLYLNLIKKALLFTLWDDPGIPFIKLYTDKQAIHDTLSKDEWARLVDAEIAVNKHGFFLMYDCNAPSITEMAALNMRRLAGDLKAREEMKELTFNNNKFLSTKNRNSL
jgi:hypothetical protein